MRTSILTILLLTFFSVQFFAQAGHFQKREEIKKKQIEFISTELQLTEKEKKEFIPIYKEFSDKKEALFQKKRSNMRNFHHNGLNMSNDELTKLADFFVDIDIQLAELGKKYNDKFKKVLPPMKIILLHKAEHEFKRELIKKIKHKGGGGHMNRP
ncbi:MAG: hypothetical protein L3J35_09790 [Bacteroidales bacterium]|nr:hypothetical protein [Bacteroidales bacterium]